MTEESQRRWRRFESFYGHEGELQREVTTCYLGKIYHVWRWRNAWYGRESCKYPGSKGCLQNDPWIEPFCPDFSTALLRVNQGERGSVWTIEELPVLVLMGGTYRMGKQALLVAEIKTKRPLNHFCSIRKRPRTLKQFAEHFYRPDDKCITRIVCNSDEVSPATLPFDKREFPPLIGRTYSDIRLDSILRLILQINKFLQTKGSCAT